MRLGLALALACWFSTSVVPVAVAQIQTPGSGSGSAGTQYDEDTGHQTGDTGNVLLCVRQDTAAALAGTDADYIPCITDSSGKIWVNAAGRHATNSANVSDKIGVLPAIVGASAPSYTDGRQATLRVKEDGSLVVSLDDNGASVDYYPGTAAANQDSQQIKASAGVLFSVTCTSIDTTVVYVKLYEDAAPESTDTVKMKLALSGADSGKVGGGHFNFGPDGIAFATAMGSRYTTGFADNDTNAVTTGEVICHFVYR